MKNLTIFILILSLSSCDYFDKKKVNSQDIVNEELQTFNWNDVDEYPSFKTCESLSSKQESKQCFETTLITHITNKLSDEIIVVTENVEDTVVIKFHISETGNLSVLNIKNKEKYLLKINKLIITMSVKKMVNNRAARCAPGTLAKIFCRRGLKGRSFFGSNQMAVRW